MLRDQTGNLSVIYFKHSRDTNNDGRRGKKQDPLRSYVNHPKGIPRSKYVIDIKTDVIVLNIARLFIFN